MDDPCCTERRLMLACPDLCRALNWIDADLRSNITTFFSHTLDPEMCGFYLEESIDEILIRDLPPEQRTQLTQYITEGKKMFTKFGFSPYALPQVINNICETIPPDRVPRSLIFLGSGPSILSELIITEYLIHLGYNVTEVLFYDPVYEESGVGARVKATYKKYEKLHPRIQYHHFTTQYDLSHWLQYHKDRPVHNIVIGLNLLASHIGTDFSLLYMMRSRYGKIYRINDPDWDTYLESPEFIDMCKDPYWSTTFSTPKRVYEWIQMDAFIMKQCLHKQTSYWGRYSTEMQQAVDHYKSGGIVRVQPIYINHLGGLQLAQSVIQHNDTVQKNLVEPQNWPNVFWGIFPHVSQNPRLLYWLSNLNPHILLSRFPQWIQTAYHNYVEKGLIPLDIVFQRVSEGTQLTAMKFPSSRPEELQGDILDHFFKSPGLTTLCKRQRLHLWIAGIPDWLRDTYMNYVKQGNIPMKIVFYPPPTLDYLESITYPSNDPPTLPDHILVKFFNSPGVRVLCEQNQMRQWLRKLPKWLRRRLGELDCTRKYLIGRTVSHKCEVDLDLPESPYTCRETIIHHKLPTVAPFVTDAKLPIIISHLTQKLWKRKGQRLRIVVICEREEFEVEYAILLYLKSAGYTIDQVYCVYTGETDTKSLYTNVTALCDSLTNCVLESSHIHFYNLATPTTFYDDILPRVDVIFGINVDVSSLDQGDFREKVLYSTARTHEHAVRQHRNKLPTTMNFNYTVEGEPRPMFHTGGLLQSS